MKMDWDDKWLERESRKIVQDSMRAARTAAGSVRCPQHGELVTVSGKPSGDFEIQACCQAAADAADRAITRALK